MNNIIVIILFILVIILFINDITQLFSFKEGAVDLPLVIGAAKDPKHPSLPEQQCISLKEQWLEFNNLIDWDTQVLSGETSKNAKIPANVCNACHLTTLASDGTTCIKN